MSKITLYKPTHRELCERAAYWLANSHRCKLVFVEKNSGCGGEEPDAIGWSSCARSSTLIEVKVSRADFLSDSKNPHRVCGGMGLYRYFLCPKGLIQPEEVPSGWGLLYATERQIRRIDVPHELDQFERNMHKEMQMMIHNYQKIRISGLIVPFNPQTEGERALP